MENSRHLLNVVIFETPSSMKSLVGRAKTEGLSKYARSALFKSAELSGVTLGPLEKGDREEPIPSNGSHWTVSHTLDFVVAVVAAYITGRVNGRYGVSPIGLDLILFPMPLHLFLRVFSRIQ